MIINALGVVGTVNNSTVVSVCTSFRIRSLKLWPPQNAGADAGFISWNDGNAFVKDDEKISSVPDGVTVTRPLVMRPPRLSTSAFWQSTGVTTQMMTATPVAGSLIDLDVEYTMANAVAQTVTAGLASVAVGTLYYLSLDGFASNKIVPVGLLSTH